MGITRDLAEFVISGRYEDLPEHAIEGAKKLLLDSLGCALAAYSLPATHTFVQVVKELGGTPECTIIGDGSKTNCVNAAYVNAKLLTYMDMDDVFMNLGHQTPTVICPALAIGERDGVDGKTLLEAIVYGYEVASRAVFAINPLFDVVEGKLIHARKVVGFGQAIFGGAASAGKCKGLDVDQMVNAFGISANYAPAPFSNKFLVDMSNSKYQMEWPCVGATLAVLLAARGFDGPQTVLDDDYFAQAMGRVTYNTEVMMRDLGTKWHIGLSSIKLYPCCRHNHYALDLFSAIKREHHLSPDEIEEVVVQGFDLIVYPPWNVHAPGDGIAGQYSIPYNLALIALDVPPGPMWMKPEIVNGREIREFASRVRLEANPELNEPSAFQFPESMLHRPTTVRVRTKSGKLIEKRADVARGDGFDETAALSLDEVEEKFLNNATYIVNKNQAEEIVLMIRGFETIKNVSGLTEMLVESTARIAANR